MGKLTIGQRKKKMDANGKKMTKKDQIRVMEHFVPSVIQIQKESATGMYVLMWKIKGDNYVWNSRSRY